MLSGDAARLSTYGGLSTERLHSLAESKYRDLLKYHTTEAEDGTATLEGFLRITGLKIPSLEPGSSSQPISSSYVFVPPKQQVHLFCATYALPRLTSRYQNKAVIPSPLPVAAAHHPAYLKKLKASRFVDTSASDPSENNTRDLRTLEQAARSYASSSVADMIENERGAHQILSAALSKARRVGLELAAQLEALNNRPSETLVAPSILPHPRSLSINVNFEVRSL